MRMLLASVALAFGLSGCADSDFVEHPITSLIPSWGDEDARSAQTAQAQPAAAAPAQSVPMEAAPPSVQAAQSAPLPAVASDHCRNLAKLRARDAAYAGEDEETQDAVYRRTYSECTAWDTRHGS